MRRDYYYLELSESRKSLVSERARHDLEYFRGRIAKDMKPGTVLMPQGDDWEAENTLGRMTADLSSLENDLDRIEKLWFCGKSVFFAAVSLAANAVYNHNSSVGLSWTYNGRNTAAKRFSTGLYLCDLMMLTELRPEMTVREFLQTVNAEAVGGIEHSTLPFTLIYSAGETEDCMCYLYQENLRDYGSDLTGMNPLPIKQNLAAASNVLDVEIWNGQDELKLVMEYNAGLYRIESMERFRDLFMKISRDFAAAGEETTLLDVLRGIEINDQEGCGFLQP